MKKTITLNSINNYEKNKCVDIFKRKDNSFGFEEFRRDFESNTGWFCIGNYSEISFNSEKEATEEATRKIIWLKDVL